MFGKILGKALSTPVRLANIPLKVVDDLCDPVRRPLSERDPIKLDEIADEIDDAFDDDEE